VVSNLLHNAAKFTPAGGWVRLAAAVEVAQPDNVAEAIIRVADNGVGIKATMLGHVFEMFAQADQGADAREAGLGIGLAIARKIVELHGGTITASSAGVGQGSEFTVRLPVAMTTAEVDSALSCDDTSLAGVRILIVDDNRDAADVIALLLKTEQAEVRTTYSAYEAFPVVAQFQPQVILMDVGMTGMSGLEACERIRRQYGQSLSLIAISGWGQDQDKVRALEAGFDLHLTKPVDPAQLQASIRALLHREGSSLAR
jgi:CheY-like chemotaxis protein